MTISEQNIVKRWEFMASKDLGIDRNVETFGFAELFKKVFEEERTQFSTGGMSYILPILRGFSINNAGYYEKCSVVECLDLSYINMDKEAAKDFDWFLMNRLGWFERYRFAQTI